MKKIFAFAILFAAVSMVACGGEQKKAEDAQEEAPATECCAECEAEKAEECCGECEQVEAVAEEVVEAAEAVAAAAEAVQEVVAE